MSGYLKRFSVPGIWHVMKKENKYAVRPSPGPHSFETSVPLSAAIRMLGYANTMHEVKKLLQTKPVLVDGRRIKDQKMPIGVMDVLSFSSLNENYRILRDHQGRALIIPISASEASRKIGKIVMITAVKGKKLQINLQDGRNILVDKKPASCGDSIVLSVPKQKIESVIVFEKGSSVYLFKGKYVGDIGKVVEIENDSFVYEKGGKKFRTLKDYAIVVGKEAPVIKLSA